VLNLTQISQLCYFFVF